MDSPFDLGTLVKTLREHCRDRDRQHEHKTNEDEALQQLAVDNLLARSVCALLFRRA